MSIEVPREVPVPFKPKRFAWGRLRITGNRILVGKGRRSTSGPTEFVDDAGEPIESDVPLLELLIRADGWQRGRA